MLGTFLKRWYTMNQRKHGDEINKIVDKLRPIDDIFFAKLAESRLFCQELLRVILGMPDLEVVEVTPQKSLRNIKGRSVALDVLCKDVKGIYFNIEVQKEDDDDHQRRVRYNSSNLDTYISEKGTKFKDLPDVYVVYISDFDLFHNGKTIYYVDRVLRDVGDILDNGFHEVYVNTQIDDGTDIAGLMQILRSNQLHDDDRYPVVCGEIRGFKVGRKRENMCKLVEEYAEKRAQEAAKKMIKKGERDYNYISDVLEISLEDVNRLADEVMVEVV